MGTIWATVASTRGKEKKIPGPSWHRRATPARWVAMNTTTALAATSTDTITPELVEKVDELEVLRAFVDELLPWAELGARQVTFGGLHRDADIRDEGREILTRILTGHYGEADLWWRNV